MKGESLDPEGQKVASMSTLTTGRDLTYISRKVTRKSK
jgi:hypothetical protein